MANTLDRLDELSEQPDADVVYLLHAAAIEMRAKNRRIEALRNALSCIADERCLTQPSQQYTSLRDRITEARAALDEDDRVRP